VTKCVPMSYPCSIEGFAIVSEDGMPANAAGIKPDSLKFEADRQFFERELDGSVWWCIGATLMSNSRVRICATIDPDPPSPVHRGRPVQRKGAVLEPGRCFVPASLAALGAPDGRVGIIGGTDVFGVFLDRYNVFHLSRVPDVRLPGGRPVFPEVPTRTPEEVLGCRGRGRRRTLDPAKAWCWLAGNVRQSSTDDPAEV
jgi:hypothetical protein